MKKNERLQALRILTKLFQENVSLSASLQSEKVTPLTQEICFGVCRYYIRLQTIADKLLTKRPKAIEVWISLLIGLYQLHFLRIPDYAVVKETVALLDLIKKPWAKGLINGVLRAYCRRQDELALDFIKTESYQTNHPKWLIKRVKKNWPDHWNTIITANDQHPPMSLRVNQRQNSRSAYLNELEKADIKATPLQFSHEGVALNKPCDVKELPGFSQGDISVQDEAAQLAASLLNLKPGLSVLDACCAPGGKTCHILETEPALAECVALDVDANRLNRVEENLNRLHLTAKIIIGDALDPNSWWDGKQFDRILLDAPCSATGVIRRHPDIKLLRAEEDITRAVEIQSELLTQLWPLLAPGGLLLYATCSIMPEENEQQAANFVRANNDCQVLNTPQPWGHNTGHGWQILPGENNMDGFFYSTLIKQE